ncbi:hypothetical protein BsWGS_21642 [Bradybaena similaris]
MADGVSPVKKARLDTTDLPECPYGARCYRKNPHHFKEYAHSSSNSSGSAISGCDSSTVIDAASSVTAAKPMTDGSSVVQLPPCKYGVNCYRKNLLHFAEFSHPTTHTSQATSDGGSDTDVYDSDEEKKPKEKSSEKKDILSKDLSLVKRFSQLTDEERKDLIKRAFEEKMKLQQELEEAKKIAEDKSRELEQLQKQMNSGLLMVDGEEEALKKSKTTYFRLLPERAYKEGSASQIHFRLAESQFYRLMTGAYAKDMCVTKVEYVVSPQVVQRFREYQKKLRKERGEDLSYPVLGFHGTNEVNIKPICEQGFKTPGDATFKHKTDAGFYGAGVYFSEYPSYSMSYIHGCSKLMLCQVLPGKVYECPSMILGAALMKGYDSHMSPCKKELVIFNSAAILPCYIIYFQKTKGDFKYAEGLSKGKKHFSDVAATSPGSKIFEGMTFALTGKLSDTQANLFDLIQEHGGTKGSKFIFNILVVPDDEIEHTSEKIRQAVKKSVKTDVCMSQANNH